MLVYSLVFIYCVAALYLSTSVGKSHKNYLELSTVVLLCILSGTRFNLGGTDYSVYKLVFDGLPTLRGYFNEITLLRTNYTTFGYEYGYLFLNSLVKTIGLNFYGFTFIHSMLFYSCLYLGLRKYAISMQLLFVVFLYKTFFYNTFISMRQSLALALFFVAIQYIEERRPLKYLLVTTLASLLHFSSLVLIPIYLINHLKISKRRIVVASSLFIPTMLFSIYKYPILDQLLPILGKFTPMSTIYKISNYLITGSLTSISIFHTLEYLLIMLLIIVFYEDIIRVNEHSELIIKLFMLLLPIFTLLRGYEILTRLKDYFTLTYAFILGYLCIINSGKYKHVVLIGTIIVCAYGYFRFLVLFDQGGLIPYESYILKGVSIFR